MSQWDDQPTRRQPAYEDPTRQQPAYQDPRYQDPHYQDQPHYQEPGVPPQQRRGPGQYHQQTYGRDQYGHPTNPFGAAGDFAFGIAGLATALIGGIVVLVALTAVDWFDNGISFGDLHDLANNTGAFTGFGDAYFGWLAWAFLIVGVIAGIASSFPSPAVRAFRAIGVVVGIAAAGLTFLAIKSDTGGPSYSSTISHTQIGFWLVIVGFVLIGVGAGIGPRRV